MVKVWLHNIVAILADKETFKVVTKRSTDFESGAMIQSYSICRTDITIAEQLRRRKTVVRKVGLEKCYPAL